MGIVRIFILLSLLAWACSPKPTLSEQLMGKWHFSRIIIDGEDVSREQNPDNDRWICFFHDGNFASDGGMPGKNTGSYSFDEVTAVLMLDSDAGEGDDSNWIVHFSKDTLVMQAILTPGQENSFIYAVRNY